MVPRIVRLRTAFGMHRIVRFGHLLSVAAGAGRRRRFLAMWRHCPNCRRGTWFEYRPGASVARAGPAQAQWQCPVCNRAS